MQQTLAVGSICLFSENQGQSLSTSTQSTVASQHTKLKQCMENTDQAQTKTHLALTYIHVVACDMNNTMYISTYNHQSAQNQQHNP